MEIKYKVGDKVWWDDPDEGYSSGQYIIVKLYEDDTALLHSLTNGVYDPKNNSEAEVYLHEIKSLSMPITFIEDSSAANKFEKCSK